MPKIIFKGITKPDDPIFDEVEPRPKNAITLKIPEHNMFVSLIFAVPFFLICLALIPLKASWMGDFPMTRGFIPLGIILGILCYFLHELLHALPQPKRAKVYIGLIPSQFMFYMKCAAPIKRGRFILMSLLPAILGLIPLVIFLLSSNPVLNAIMWPMAMVGLVSPSPDYLNVYEVLRQVPKNAYIQDSKDGMCWFVK